MKTTNQAYYSKEGDCIMYKKVARIVTEDTKTEETVKICPSCKRYWIMPVDACTCGQTSRFFEDTHPSNANRAENFKTEESQEDVGFREYIENTICSMGLLTTEGCTRLALEIISDLNKHGFTITRKS